MDPFGLYDDEPSSQERAHAMAEALRGKEALGTLFQMTGDRAIAPAGAGMLGQVARDKEQLGEAKKFRLMQAIQARKEALNRQQELSDRNSGNREWDRRNAITSAEAELRARIMAARENREKTDAAGEKKKAGMYELEDRFSNIKDRIKQVRTMLDEDGSYELFGSHNDVLSGLLNEIATDQAKVMDPSSVARESEVKAARQNLPNVAVLGQTNDTALEILKKYEENLDKRRESAYKVRGLQMPASAKRVRDPKTGKEGDWDGVSPLPPGVEVVQ